jgi:hypothetical protein
MKRLRSAIVKINRFFQFFETTSKINSWSETLGQDYSEAEKIKDWLRW